jgi:hypothetical protein
MNLHRRWDSVFAEARSTELEFQVSAPFQIMTASRFQAPHQLHLRGLWPVPASLECPSQCDTAPTKLEGPKASPSLPGVRCEGQLPGPTATVNSAGVLGPLVGRSQCQSQPEVAAAAQCDTPPTTLEGPGPMAARRPLAA